MLEGAVARILNQLLGKYIVDLDTENLNVGIFSGQVQLNDLKLKSEALYELNLPIEVVAGTIGKVYLQIPWSSLWSQPVVITMEDVHIVASPIVRGGEFDGDKNKRLLRALKRKAIADLNTETELIGGPSMFSEYLITNIVNNLQLNVSNVHVRYEDTVSRSIPVVLGICIGSIIAETTNGKWKPGKNVKTTDVCFYLVKMEAFCVYCNPKYSPTDWNLPTQYYNWRNAMSNSLHNYSMNGEDFEFLIRPMTAKIKMTINKSANGKISKLLNEIVVHDLNMQVSQEQYQTIRAIQDSLTRMFISWDFIANRPQGRVKNNAKAWWRFAYRSVGEQRIKPFTWSRIKAVRVNYRKYMEIYKRILLNPNDTELKLDLQLYEDKLNIVNIVIARKQATLLIHSTSLSEKSFWDILPSPERQTLCESIGFQEDKLRQSIEFTYNFRIGNTNVTLTNAGREIFVLTMTQLISSYQPNFIRSTYVANLKIEGIIVEGASKEDHLVSLVSSNHQGQDSPAYFLKIELEKLDKRDVKYRVDGVLEYLEVAYHKHAFTEIETYFAMQDIPFVAAGYCTKLSSFMKAKLNSKWDFSLDLKLPYIVIPECGGENMLVADVGHCKVRTEICQELDGAEDATQMELEEQMYSTFHFDCSGTQVLFCGKTDLWRDSRKEKNTELHVIPKTNAIAIFSSRVGSLKTIPRYKLNITIPTIKINLSERKLLNYLKFMQTFEEPCRHPVQKRFLWEKDRIVGKLSGKYLLNVQSSVILLETLIKNKRIKDRSGSLTIEKRKNSKDSHQKENMNEVWARCVDLPGLEDNISPCNLISTIFRIVINECQMVFSRSTDSTDRQYLSLRLGLLAVDWAWMTYGPACQVSLGSLILTDKFHTTPSGQYLDLIHSPFPNTVDLVTLLYRKVAANCPDFWTHFHGVETSLVADFGVLNVMLHQEAFNTIIKYSVYLNEKIKQKLSSYITGKFGKVISSVKTHFTSKIQETPVPPGSVKFSHSARLSDLNVRICEFDFDIASIHISGLEADFLFRANERFVFRSFLSKINVDHLSDISLYPKVLYTDEDKVFEVKYVRYSTNLNKFSEISPSSEELNTNGSFKFHLGQLHVTFLYKLVVQLHRFVGNLEVFPYMHKVYDLVNKFSTKATDSLRASTKIHIAINLKGPVLLIPQKSSSPNVVIIDTGDLTVENFFKEYQNETVENLLMKLDNITISRGVMTLTSTLEMQETIMEPVNLHLDIKHFIPLTKSSNKPLTWDIDGIMDTIQITLGQRDLTIILAICTENIVEGKLIDLFPETLNPVVDTSETDEVVRSLEAFFCEPKQKDISVRFSFENITLMLFFDSGELLSSPIRDLNHGLCKLEVTDIATSFVVYTDKSLDGKLTVDSVTIEELGPDANNAHRKILQTPSDDNKNNNCNITVNQPPIIDVTFHKNKSEDKSIDMIVGRLSLSLSVPFCEKVATFVLECAPRECLDTGIINLGYVCEQQDNKESNMLSSLTIALRINKPEFIFLVETASNNKRYFITKTEILVDFSRHSNRENFVISLSGLHTCFYDISINFTDPYTIMKQCDIELSKSYTSEKGEKITASVSSIYLQFCNRVVYSINDILNDVVEHFKLPEAECSPKELRKLQSCEMEDLWEPKKATDYVKTSNEELVSCGTNVHEIFLLPKTDIIVIFELEEIPVMIFRSTVELTLYDWSSFVNCTCEATIQANYFNDNIQLWEPLIDPVVLDENVYKPWEIFVKVFQDKAQTIFHTENKCKIEKGKKGAVSQSTTEDEDESGDDMVYLEPANGVHNRSNRRVKTSLSTFLDDSDSENEDGSMEKLAAAISDLFTGDWNESEGSECELSSDGENESDDNVKSREFSISENANYKKATYILVDAKDVLNVSITPAFLKLFNDLYTIYSNKTLSIANSSRAINIVNDIGPQSKVSLYENRGSEKDAESVMVICKTYEKEDSCPNSPARSVYFGGDFLDEGADDRDSITDDNNRLDQEMVYDFETVNSLDFERCTTANLYDRINKHQLRIQVPGFNTIQTSCPKKVTEKLIRLQSQTSNQLYYLVAKTTISKHGRNVVVSSPLQIRNETCFAISILYQPSVLQQLNLEPVGDVTNPFETTMRIAVLEPHEQYNVPLYIAYHCKLFLQPAYAEGHYACNTGIWWRDLVTDLDTAHNFHCNPKSSSNVEVFSLRVMLKKNINVSNSHAHSIPNYIIHLLPPLILHNVLPYTLIVENVLLGQQMKVEPGEKTSVYSLNLSTDQKLLLRINYYNSAWVGNLTLTPHLDEKVVVFIAEAKVDSNWSRQLAINVKAERDDSCNLFFYTPYWIVNKTALPLYVKASSTNTTYGSKSEDIILFTYKRHGKQTLQLKVYDSDWSNDFGLDCAGTTGLVVCKDNERKKRYSFLLSIRLSEMCTRLTKIVTLLPSFLVMNSTTKRLRPNYHPIYNYLHTFLTGKHNFRFMEHNEKTDLWIDLAPGQNTPFWPETTSMQMYVKLRDSKVTSQAFPISAHYHTVLRIDKRSAICVNVSGGKTEPFLIQFEDYSEGDAPICVRNMCADLFLKIQQQGQSPVTLLSPNHTLLYTWDDPTKPRRLIWNVYNNKSCGYFVDISKDGYGEEKINFHSVSPGTANTIINSSSEDSDSSDSGKTTLNKKVRRDKISIYWICYREDKQKVLFFTQNQRDYNSILQTTFLQTCDLECLVSLAGIGVSLHTSASKRKEHLYCSLSDAPATWEVNVGHKWKTLTLELASWIEDKYRLNYKKCQLKDYVHIDFEKMFMLKPFFAELRRSYSPAVYAQFRKSSDHRLLNLRIQAMQIDNKLVNSNESVVLCPSPVESLKVCTPFIDFGWMKTASASCDIYKHLRLNVRDFFVNLQSDLLEQVARCCCEYSKASTETTLLYRNDMAKIHSSVIAVTKDITKVTIIEELHLSTTQIQLNIQNKSQSTNATTPYPISTLLSYFFPHNISPYMPIEGVRHKITPLEVFDVRCDFIKGTKLLLNHFGSQFLQQYYAQVLGLQVLVNPYALQTVTINERVPNDAEKMASLTLFGCRCLLGHLNMSSVALEQCIVDMFVNQSIENIQRIRRHGSYHNTSSVPKVITSSSRNFNPGVILALDQIIAKSKNGGLQCDGELFFRGTGKALVSLVTRHPDEKSDCVQVAIEALRRASLLGEPIKIHQRLTRYSNRFLGLKPFSVYESMGHHLLETLANGRFANDTYWIHGAIDKQAKSIIIVSLEHVLRANKCRLWGPWDLEWSLDLDEIISVPKVTTAQLVFNVRQGDSDINATGGKLQVNGDKEVLVWLQEKIEQAIVVSMEDKSWTLNE